MSSQRILRHTVPGALKARSAAREDARPHALLSPPPFARPAQLGARLKPRLHSPSPPRRSPGTTNSPSHRNTVKHHGQARDAGLRAKRWDEARQSRPREPATKQPAHEETGPPGGGRAGRARGERKLAAASPGYRAQGTWPERGKGRGKGKPCTETGSWPWPGGPQGARAGRPTAIPFPKGSRRRGPYGPRGNVSPRARRSRGCLRPRSASPAPRHARPPPGSAPADGPWGGGTGRGPTGPGLRPPSLGPGGIAPHGAPRRSAARRSVTLRQQPGSGCGAWRRVTGAIRPEAVEAAAEPRGPPPAAGGRGPRAGSTPLPPPPGGRSPSPGDRRSSPRRSPPAPG